MSDYLRIARAYLSRTTAAVWCFLFLCLLGVSVLDGNPISLAELAHNQGGILGGVLSRKSYMAMFAYFNACVLGVLLRDNIAHPWASVLPRYRQKHLLVTTFIAVFFLAIPMFSMGFIGTSDIAPTSVAVIFLTCLAAGLWTLDNSVLAILVFPFLAFVMAPSSSFPGFSTFIAGTNPAASAALVCMSLLALWALARRLLTLNEEMVEYAIARMWGDLLRGRGAQAIRGQALTIADHVTVLPADQRAPLQPRDSLFSNLKQVDNLAGYSERSLSQRLQLWRLGTTPMRTSVSLAQQIVILLIVTPLFVLIPPLVGPDLPARGTVVNFSVMVMTNPFVIWHFWIMRLHRLGYESLRPRTRPEFVRELGLALLWDNIQCWLGGILFMGIAATFWAPELLQAEKLLQFILCTGVGQLCAYSLYAMMGNWLLKRGTVASVSCAFCPFLAMASWMLFIAQPIGVELNVAIASVLAVASVATIALAYRRWCRADLD